MDTPGSQMRKMDTFIVVFEFNRFQRATLRILAIVLDLTTTKHLQYQPQAAMNGHYGCITTLVCLRADVDANDRDCRTPLHQARTAERRPKILCSTAKALNVLNICRLQAAIKGQSECIAQLLKYRANLEAKDAEGRTPRDLAKDEGIRKLLCQVDILEGCGPNLWRVLSAGKFIFLIRFHL